jgi:hypothetical protein
MQGHDVVLYFNAHFWGIDGKVVYGFSDSKLESASFCATSLQTFWETWNAYALLEDRMSGFLGQPDHCRSFGGTTFRQRGCPPPVKLTAEKDTEFLLMCNDGRIEQTTEWAEGWLTGSETLSRLELSGKYFAPCAACVRLMDGWAFYRRGERLYEAAKSLAKPVP